MNKIEKKRLKVTCTVIREIEKQNKHVLFVDWHDKDLVKKLINGGREQECKRVKGLIGQILDVD